MQNVEYAAPFNLSTLAEYSGENVGTLLGAQISNAYPTAGWVTFMQALSLGRPVLKGSKGTKIWFIQPGKEEETGKKVCIRKCYTVFNEAQIETEVRLQVAA